VLYTNYIVTIVLKESCFAQAGEINHQNNYFMNRRNSISAIFGSNYSKNETTTTAPPSTSLNPYTGPWTKSQASHLMRRTMFGPNPTQVDECFENGIDTTLDILFDNCVPTPPPVIYTVPEEPSIFPVFIDPFVEFGETWVNEPELFSTGDPEYDRQILNYRRFSVESWPFVNFMKPELNIMPKLWTFWHNHFVVSGFEFPLTCYEYSKVIETHAKGNFKQFAKDMTIDVGMLMYLNGNLNSKEAPNENYARELLELFTVGKGDIAGPGDYTTFTEQDVEAMSRSLTGWGLEFYDNETRLRSAFNPDKHDTGDKELSHRFNNEVIADGGADEYKNLIDVIFQQEAVAKFLAGKLYGYFVSQDINDEVVSNIIEPMAAIIREDDYEIERALKTLLSSEHFFSEEVVGCMIKNPCDFILSTTRGLNYEFTGGPARQYFFAVVWRVFHGELDMGIFYHPTVAGWKAYYQAPNYYRWWINTYYLPKRNKISAGCIGGGSVPYLGGQTQIVQLPDLINYISQIENADDPNALIYGISNNLLVYPITENQKDFLKEVIIPGLPDFEWTVEYGEFLGDPLNEEKRNAINNKLVALFRAITEMPEFQLM